MKTRFHIFLNFWDVKKNYVIIFSLMDKLERLLWIDKVGFVVLIDSKRSE